MHRSDNSRFMLYIEPKASEKKLSPIIDKLTMVMELALQESEPGTENYSNIGCRESFTKNNGYCGYHVTECGVRSSNQDYLLKNGMITNSLAPFYLMHYRNSIPISEMGKVIRLYSFYKLSENERIIEFKSKYIATIFPRV